MTTTNDKQIRPTRKPVALLPAAPPPAPDAVWLGLDDIHGDAPKPVPKVTRKPAARKRYARVLGHDSLPPRHVCLGCR
jgi:hypothetical protein